MPVTKKYDRDMVVGGTPTVNAPLAAQALETAGFKKVKISADLTQVEGVWKPMFGKLWGDISLTFAADGENTRIHLHSRAAVDNVFTLVESPGARIFAKFTDVFKPAAAVSA